MFFTERERRAISESQRMLQQYYPHLSVSSLDPNPAVGDQIAVQFFMGLSTRGGSKKSPDHMRLLLGKLRDVTNGPQTLVAVTWDVKPMRAQSWFERLFEKYSASWQGVGTWSPDKLHFELVLAGVFQVTTSNCPAVLNYSHILALRDTYKSQADEGNKAQLAQRLKKNDKVATEDDPLSALAGQTTTARRESASEGRGTCYRCNSIKPRGKICAVCGYMPRTAL